MHGIMDMHGVSAMWSMHLCNTRRYTGIYMYLCLCVLRVGSTESQPQPRVSVIRRTTQPAERLLPLHNLFRDSIIIR